MAVFEDMTFCISDNCTVAEKCQRHISKCNVKNGTLVSMADFTKLCEEYRYVDAVKEVADGKG